MDAALLGWDTSLTLRRDWELIKGDVMHFVIMQKFKQNRNARNILLSTGDRRLVEHTKNDSFWADCGDGTA